MEIFKWLGRFYEVAFRGNSTRAAFGCIIIGLAFGIALYYVSRTSYLNLVEKGSSSPTITVTGGDGSVNTGQNNGRIDIDNRK